jgi:hypothetical protein
MNPEVIALIDKLLAIDWQIVVGLLFAPLFLLLGTWLLIRAEWPWDDKYRGVTLGGVFLLIGALAASGAANIVSGFWGVIYFAIFIWLAYQVYKRVQTWLKGLPVAGQVYYIPGIGDVTITRVIGMDPLHGFAFYEDISGEEVKVPVIQLLYQGELDEDHCVESKLLEQKGMD